MDKLQALRALSTCLRPDDLVIACNGMIGRELFTVGDRSATFYMIGSMGLGLSIGLGLAMARPERRVVVLDGDGNVLMGLGAVASAAAEAPPNLLHVVLDNRAHASTGGQRTITERIELETIAGAAGYRATHRAADPEAFGDALRAALRQPGPVMVVGVVDPGTLPGIARVSPSPPEIARRFAEECRRSPRAEEARR